ncbi:MAG TPA: DEAD/DEAH box helicase [Terriglobales bacterium]|nr:DEAD/DEAH box helicase [Terriglobales bacterium]
MNPDSITDIYSYMRCHAIELGERILSTYPALHQVDDAPSPLLRSLLRQPFPAQTLAIMGLVKRWELARSAKVIAECGTGKTLISLGAMHVHSGGRPFTALAMVPPHIVEKWAREAFQTIPGIRVFLIDSLRNGGAERLPQGVNEVRLKRGAIVREGLHTSLSDLRLRKDCSSAGQRWKAMCGRPSLFIVGRDRAKLGYFWRHAYRVPNSGRYCGCVVNPESGTPIITDEGRLTRQDLGKVRIAEVLTELSDKSCRSRYAPLWQADHRKIPRVAPVDFISRYMQHFFDYAIGDELHQLAGDTAQGNALGTLAASAERVVGLTGTLLGGYADDLYNILFRLQPQRMIGKGYEWGASGRSAFAQDYGVLETITRIEAAENACSDGKTTVTVRRKPGASPLLFGEFLMDSCAFVFLEDISDALPAYEESVVQVTMDAPMLAAYEKLEADMSEALKAHRGNRSVLSIMLNALLLYPDHPYGLGKLWGTEIDEDGRRQRFLIAEPQDLPEQFAYAKERRLLEEIRKELAEGRRCQIFVVYTQKRDVTSRLQRILQDEGISCAIMRSNIDTSKREAWYERRLKEGVQVFIAHPKLVETGLDLLFAPTIIFYESGYSLHTLRQASRRSWRIGQRQPVRVKFLCYENTMQAKCLRLMGKKLLVALAMEGKFADQGLQTLDEDEDMLTSMAKELVQKNGIGESADAVWKQLNREHQRLFPTPTRSDHMGVEPEIASISDADKVEPATALIESVLNSKSVLVFGEKPEAQWRARRRPRAPAPEQGLLFD